MFIQIANKNMVIRKLFGGAFEGDTLIDKAMSSDSFYYGQDDAQRWLPRILMP